MRLVIEMSMPQASTLTRDALDNALVVFEYWRHNDVLVLVWPPDAQPSAG